MEIKIQKSTVLFPTFDLNDKKFLGKKMKTILALSILSKICIAVPLNKEKIFKSEDDYKWKYTQTNNEKGRQFVWEVLNFLLWEHYFGSFHNFFVSELDS